MKGVLLVILMVFSFMLSAEPCLRISTVEAIAAHPEISDLVRQAYLELGYQVEIIPMPAKRSLHQARDDKDIDAELARTRYAKNYLPNHIVIPVPIGHITVAAFVSREDIEINDWEDLQAYKVGGVRGHLFLEDKLSHHSNGFLFSDANQVLTMLTRGRIDVAVLPRTVGEYVIKQYGHQSVELIMPPLDYVPLYHFVHRKHQNIANQLSDTLDKLTIDAFAKHYQ